MKQEYIDFLHNTIQLELLPPIRTSNDHHNIKCLICEDMFKATPKSKKQNFKKHNIPGCPQCTDKVKYGNERDNIVLQLNKLGIELVEPYKGNNKTPHRVRNIKCCGREWVTRPDNLLTGRAMCRPCNDERKRSAFQQFNDERHQEALLYLEGFAKYRKQVRVLSEKTYRDHGNLINPDKLTRSNAGNDGYHLDHIVSIYTCFHADVPPDLCAHPDNLQMLYWEENIRKHNKPPRRIPAIMESYIQQ